ncbi:MAG: sarcosine oxidase subunit gamma [Gammaproteobacteria bacterium]
MARPLAARHPTIEGAVRMTAESPGALILVDGARVEALKSALDRHAPGLAIAPQRSAISGPLTVLASGPDQWLLVHAREPAGIWLDRLAASLDENTAVVDQSDARVAVVLEGSDAAEVLLTGTPYEVDSMTPGDCTATRLSHFHVLVERQAEERFRVFFTRSFALAAWDWLLQARAEFDS